MVVSLALVSSLAVGIAAAGGLSVLDEPRGYGGAETLPPPQADPKPPALLPDDPGPPPAPNPAEPVETEEFRDNAPAAHDTFDTRQVEAETAPDAVDEVEQTGSGVWHQVEDTVDELPIEWPEPTTHVFTWENLDCPEGETEYFASSGGYDLPSWDTGYSDPWMYERLSH